MSSKSSINLNRIVSLVIEASILGLALFATRGYAGITGDDAIRHAALSGGTTSEFNTMQTSDNYSVQCESNRPCRADNGRVQ